MKKTVAIIDGYNVINRVEIFRRHLDVSLLSARQALVRYCSRWLLDRRDYDEFVIVFDGNSSVMPYSVESRQGVRVLFTQTKEEADDRILAILKDNVDRSACVVISSDNYVAGNARILGAKVVDVDDFIRRLSVRNGQAVGRRPDVDDALSPAEERVINERLKKEWGLE